jgi:hypothetical protein
MPVPYKKRPRATREGCVAYLDVLALGPPTTFYAALLLLDSRGQPLEFVHNSLSTPSGFLWPEDRSREWATASLAHSLFDACRREPELLLCPSTLGTPEFCATELAPSLPCALLTPDEEEGTAWTWVNDPPTPGMAAWTLTEELRRRGYLMEAFARLRRGLREVYPEAPWPEGRDDSLPEE